MDQECSGTFLRIRKVQNLFNTSPCEEAHQQAGFGDNPVSITEFAETQLCVPQNISKEIPTHLSEKKCLGDFMLTYIQMELALENVIWFMLLRKNRFQDSFISIFIILRASPLTETTYSHSCILFLQVHWWPRGWSLTQESRT